MAHIKQSRQEFQAIVLKKFSDCDGANQTNNKTTIRPRTGGWWGGYLGHLVAEGHVRGDQRQERRLWDHLLVWCVAMRAVQGAVAECSY